MPADVRFDRVLLTGAAGSIGSCLRRGLGGELDELRLTDSRPVDELSDNETYVAADLTDPSALARAMAGVEAVIHLGGVPDEASFEALVGPNVHGTFNVFEAARRAGATRVVYASSNRITGFYPVSQRLSGWEPPRPDGLYAATKAWGEALGRLYADKFGLEVICLRIGSFEAEPTEPRHLETWLSHGDAVRLFRACLTARDVGFLTVYGASANSRSWWDLEESAERLGYVPHDDAEQWAERVGSDAESRGRQGDPFTAPDYGGWAAE